MLVAVAVLKPWGSVAPAPTARPVATSAAGGATGSGAPRRGFLGDGLDPSAVPCLTYDEWRVTSIEQTSGEETRRWIAIVPVPASGPLDKWIPSVRIVAAQLKGIGYCAPDSVLVTGTPTVYRVQPRNVVLVAGPGALHRLVPRGFHAAEIYRPATGATWIAGRYILSVPIAAGGEGERSQSALWFGVEVVNAPPFPPVP